MRLTSLLILSLMGVAYGQTPPGPQPPPVPKPPAVIFPSDPTPILPPPSPSSRIRLIPDTLYIVRANTPCIVLTSPQGIVSVTADTGPMKIMAKIWPSNVTQTLKFAEPYIYVVEAKVSGTAELIVIPEGTKDVASITRKLIQAELAPLPPPDPPPDPPIPTPNPAPIPVAGFRSLIVYESADLSKMPASQVAALYSQQVRDYLTSHCTMGPDGKTKEWRTWDKDADTSNEAKLWQDAMKRPRKEVPWIILSDGKKGFEGPLPKTEADLLTLLKTIGG